MQCFFSEFWQKRRNRSFTNLEIMKVENANQKRREVVNIEVVINSRTEALSNVDFQIEKGH